MEDRIEFEVEKCLHKDFPSNSDFKECFVFEDFPKGGKMAINSKVDYDHNLGA